MIMKAKTQKKKFVIYKKTNVIIEKRVIQVIEMKIHRLRLNNFSTKFIVNSGRVEFFLTKSK